MIIPSMAIVCSIAGRGRRVWPPERSLVVSLLVWVPGSVRVVRDVGLERGLNGQFLATSTSATPKRYQC